MHNISNQMVESLEKLLQEVPLVGTFSRVSVSFPVKYEKLSMVVELALGPWSEPDSHTQTKDWKKMRYIELKVSPEGQKVDSSTWLFTGTKHELEGILRSKENVIPFIEKTFERSVQHLERDFLHK